MRTRIVILSALALLGASLLLFAQNPPAAERLNEAQQMEAQKGLKAAIERYESVLQDFPNDEAAGVAIARIVKLYEIMGKSDDMLNACERLMSRWPKVKDQVSELCVPRTMPGIFIAKMDPQSGVIQDPVRSMTANPRQTEVFPTFSPDGALLAFTRLRNTPRLEAMLDSVIVRSLNDRSERPMKGCGEGSTVGGAHPLWLPDRSLLFVNTLLANSMPPNQPHCIGFNDSQTGELRRSLDYPTQALASAWSAVSPDGKTLYTLLGAAFFNRPTTMLVTLNLETGDVKDVFTLPYKPVRGVPGSQGPNWFHPTLAISPDGQTLVQLKNPMNGESSQLVRFATEGADRHYQELFSAGTQIKGVAFSKDGNRIFFGVSEDGVKWRIMQVPARGGPASFTGLEVKGMFYFEPNPANTEIAFDGLEATISAPGPYTPPPAVPSPAGPSVRGGPGGPGGRGGRG